MFASIEWEDGFVSIISVASILTPRRELNQYKAGDGITAKWRGKVYSATILEIRGKMSCAHIGPPPHHTHTHTHTHTPAITHDCNIHPANILTP